MISPENAAAGRLHQWATGLIHSHKATIRGTSADLSPEHFHQLVANNAVCSVLLQASEQVATPAHVRQVRLNLQLASLRKQWLAKDEDDMHLHILRQRAAVVEADMAISKTAAQLADTSRELHVVSSELQRCRRRRLLLESEGARLLVETRACRQLHTALHNTAQHWDDRLHASPGDTRAAVEHHVGLVLQLRRDLLDEGRGEERLQKDKVLLWETLAKHGAAHNSTAVVSALTDMARADTTRVQRITTNLDLRADAAKLRLKYSASDGLVDSNAASRGVTSSVRQQLCQMYGAHVEAHLAASALTLQADGYAAARDAICNNLLQAITHQHPCSASANTVQSLVQRSVAVAGLRAALQALHKLKQRLHDEADRAQQQEAALQEQHQRIQAFEDVVRSNVHRLKCLCLAVERGNNSLREQRATARRAAADTLMNLQLPAPTTLVHSLAHPLQLMAALPLSCLASLHVKGRGMVLERDLAIATADTDTEDDPRLLRALDKVVNGSSSALSRECAAAAVCSTQAGIATHSARASLCTQNSTGVRSEDVPSLHTNAIKSLCERVDAHDEQLERDVQQALDTCGELVRRAGHTLATTQRAIDVWWEQPARKIRL